MHNPAENLLAWLASDLDAMTLRIAATACFSHSTDPERAAKRAVLGLERQGFVFTYERMIASTEWSTLPLADCGPDDPEPAFTAISYVLMTRSDGTHRPETFLSATKMGARRFGGTGRSSPIREVDSTHHAHLAWVYACCLSPEERSRWIGEHALTKFWPVKDYLPDAVLRGLSSGGRASGNSWRDAVLMEVGGTSYSAGRLRAVRRTSARLGCRFRIY